MENGRMSRLRRQRFMGHTLLGGSKQTTVGVYSGTCPPSHLHLWPRGGKLQRPLSSSLQVIPNWRWCQGEELIHSRAGLLFRGTGWRNGPTVKFNKDQCQVLHLARRNPSQWHSLQLCGKGTLGLGRHQIGCGSAGTTEGQQHPSLHYQQHSWCIKGSDYQHLLNHI